MKKYSFNRNVHSSHLKSRNSQKSKIFSRIKLSGGEDPVNNIHSSKKIDDEPKDITQSAL